MVHRHVPAAALALAAFACSPGAAPAAGPEAATAVLHPTRGSEAQGVVRFRAAADGTLRVETRVVGLSPGPHAYHVHLYGDCSAPDGTSAGTHFNFVGSSLDPPDDIDRITGNLGVLEAGEDGEARHAAPVEKARLDGPKSIVGRAVVVHARGNDPDSPPIGAAGARVACGVIGIAEGGGDDGGP